MITTFKIKVEFVPKTKINTLYLIKYVVRKAMLSSMGKKKTGSLLIS